MTPWISYKYTYIPSFLSLSPNRHPTPLGCYRALSWGPCANFCFPPAVHPTHGRAYTSGRCLNLCHPLLPPLCPHVHSLCPPLCSPFSASASLQSVLCVRLSAVRSLCLHLCSWQWGGWGWGRRPGARFWSWAFVCCKILNYSFDFCACDGVC